MGGPCCFASPPPARRGHDRGKGGGGGGASGLRSWTTESRIVLTNFADAGSPPAGTRFGRTAGRPCDLNKFSGTRHARFGVIVARSTESSSIVALAAIDWVLLIKQLEDSFAASLAPADPVLRIRRFPTLASKLPAALLICPAHSRRRGSRRKRSYWVRLPLLFWAEWLSLSPQ